VYGARAARLCMYVCMYVCMCACVCVVVRHSDLLTRATTICLHVEHDYMTGTKLCKMIPARYTYAPVVLRVAGRGVKEKFCRKLKCVLFKVELKHPCIHTPVPFPSPILVCFVLHPFALARAPNLSASPTLIYSHHPCNDCCGDG